MKKKNIFKTTTLLLMILLIIGLATAQVITNINLNLNSEDKLTLLKVGDGIGTVEKVREICINDSECFNETYIDNLKLIGEKVNDKFTGNFKLYEEGGINKEFKVKLESICSKEGMCEEFGESYECCLEWRAETDEEVLIKAKLKSKEILNRIVSVTLDRESRQKENRFEEIEVNI